MNYGGLFRSALVALLWNKMRSLLTVLGITIGIAAVICVVAIGKAGQARVQQQEGHASTFRISLPLVNNSSSNQTKGGPR